MLFLVMLRCIRVPFSSPQRVILCGYIAAFHAFGGYLYIKNALLRCRCAGAPSCQFRVAKPVPCRSSDSGLVRRPRLPKSLQWHMQPTRPLQRRVRAGFSPGFPLSRPPSDGTWNMFILFSTLSRYNLFVNLYHAFGVLVIFTNRKS